MSVPSMLHMHAFPCLLNTNPGMSSRHTEFTCPSQLVAITSFKLLKTKDLESSLLFLSHSQVSLGNSVALPSEGIRNLITSYHSSVSHSHLLPAWQVWPPIWSPLFFHCLLISFSAQERSSSETQIRACPLPAQAMQCSGPLSHYMPSPSLVHHSHYPGPSTWHAQSHHRAFAPAAPSAWNVIASNIHLPNSILSFMFLLNSLLLHELLLWVFHLILQPVPSHSQSHLPCSVFLSPPALTTF